MARNVPACTDCGEYPVIHGIEWTTALMDSVITFVLAPLDAAVGPFQRAIVRYLPADRLALPILRVMAFLHLGTLRTDVDDADSSRTKFLWQSAKERGIKLYEFPVMDDPTGTVFFVAMKAGRARAFEGLPRPVRGGSKSLTWMDNKAILKKKFLAAGIPMAQGQACFSFETALKTMNRVGVPVITKPHIGSRSRHSTVRIMTPDDLAIGFTKAKQLSPWVIVEQELQGYLFRVLLVDGKVAGIIRREVAHVTGDAIHTIRELFETENRNPLRNGPTFHHLRDDQETAWELARQGLTWADIPAAGKVVNFSNHISRYYGGSTSDFTERAHPDNLALFEHIAATLGDSLVGVDFIIEDMEKSWREQKLCGVIECNSLPNIDLHHDVLYGKNRDIAGLLLDLAFRR